MSSGDSFLQLGGKVVIITGASSGIGEATAYEFAKQGCQLMLGGRSKERLSAVAEKCAQLSGKKVEKTVGDIVDEQVQQAIIDNTVKAFGCIDVLVNNAGMNILGSCLDQTRGDYQRIMSTNVESVFFLSQIAAPHLVKSKGNIVNVSSIASENQLHKCAVYSMSKAAIDNFTKCMAIELASSGVRVNAVNPGSVITRVYKREGNFFSDERLARFAIAQADIHPLGRVVEAEEVADTIVYLASPRSSCVTGQMVFVANGRQIAYPQAKFKDDKEAGEEVTKG